MVLGPVVEIEKIEPKNQNKCKRWKERRNPHNQQTAKKFLTTPVVCRKHKWSLSLSQNTIHSKTPKTETGEALNRKTETEHTLNKISRY